MTTMQQAELQAKISKLVQDYRQKHALSPVAIFDALASFCWELARSEGNASSEEIANRLRVICEACELAYRHATAPAPPFDRRQS